MLLDTATSQSEEHRKPRQECGPNNSNHTIAVLLLTPGHFPRDLVLRDHCSPRPTLVAERRHRRRRQMPTSTRKSSVGTARRSLQKAHIPYRGDNPEVGKKTGIAVQHVQRKSDGFEPFEEVMQQADGRTPPRPKKRKKKAVMVEEDDDEDEEQRYSDDDEDGEMSMQLDSPLPSNNLTTMRVPTTPTTNGRVGSSRAVARSSNVDFDKIPSPRPRNMANAGPGPSRLSRSYIAKDMPPSSESQENNDDDDGRGGFDDFGPQEGDGDAPRRTSFTQMDQDEDEEDEEIAPFQDPSEEDPISEAPKKSGKGKTRAVEEDLDDEQMEEDIVQGLADVGTGDESEELEEPEPEPEPKPRAKKVKITAEENPRTKTRSTGKKENRDYREGVRRSTREHYKPLDYWRGEKVVYGRLDFSAPCLVPQIKEIIRIPKEDSEPLRKRKRGRSRSRTVQPTGSAPAPAAKAMLNPEEGWDDDTPSIAKVLDYRNGQEVERRIAWTSKMVNPQPVANNWWSFDKIFGDADFIAAGQLVIPPNSRKPSKATKDNTYIFYVIEGAVNLKVHDTSMVLATGGMFMVPRGNTYFIENISQRDAKLFFTQARKTLNDDDERVIALANRQKKKTQRSSSAGAMAGQSARTNGRASSGLAGSDATPLAARASSMRV